MRAARVCPAGILMTATLLAASAAFAGDPGTTIGIQVPTATPTLSTATRPPIDVISASSVDQLVQPASIAGRIHQTLYQAARHAGLNRQLTATLIRVFSRRVDFRHDIHAGDRFVVLREKTGDTPRIVAAELDLRGQTLHAYRYTVGDGKSAWYSAGGKPLRPTLLRTPVDYTRVSSPFSLRRLNPVLHIYRPHYGVDLAAPVGTPIHAAGDGTVTFRGPDGGYGNLIIINNPGPYSTRYGHMRNFRKGIHVGSHVHQGEVIGYVGETGLATGPHLHFEIRVDGKPRPPLKVKLPHESLQGKALVAYDAAISPLTDALDPTPRQPAGVQVAAADENDDAPAPPGKRNCTLGTGSSLALCLLNAADSSSQLIGNALATGLAMRFY